MRNERKMGNRLRLVSLLVTVLLFSCGCATALRGTKQKVTFRTEPADATVNVDGTDYPAPAEVVLARRERHVVMVSKQGYQSVQFDFEGKLDPMTLGQFAIPGGSLLVGGDVASGGALQYNKMAIIKLEKVDAPTT